MSDNMVLDTLIETMTDLAQIMDEESDLLSAGAPGNGNAELTQAKIRLTAKLDANAAELKRRDANWMETLEGEERDVFRAATEALSTAAERNHTILARQIDLSAELLAAVGKEMERLTGRRGSTYSRAGAMQRSQGRIPLSINQRY